MNWSTLSRCSKLIFLFISGIISAQSSLETLQKKYSGYNQVVLKDILKYEISLEKGKPKIVKNDIYEAQILTDVGIQYDSESFTSSELVQVLDFEAYTITNQNKKIKVTHIEEKAADQSGIFFSNIKEKQFSYPNLEPGAIKVLNHKTLLEDMFLLHKHLFVSNNPIASSVFEIKVDKAIAIDFKIFNDAGNKIAFNKTEKGSKIIYTWSIQDVLPPKREANSPGYLYNVPHIDFWIKNYTVGNATTEVLGDVSKLYKYYRSFTKNLNQNLSDNLRQTAQTITENKTSEEEKVKSIFYWVKNNIKYIAFENGYEGFIPREASLVCERKFGDCKDMASLITAMCNSVSIQNVFITWIGTREIPYSYLELSTPSVDNHMIAVYKKEGKYIFLDGTDKETRYGIPTAFIQGKEALIGQGDHYEIVKVQVLNSTENVFKEAINLQIDNNNLLGAANAQLTGYYRSHTLMKIGDATNKNRFDFIKKLVLKGNNKFNLTEYKEKNIEDRDMPYEIDYKFELNNYIVKVDDAIYVNMFLDRTFEKLDIENNRESQFEFDFLSESDLTITLDIPEKKMAKYIPENFKLENELLSCNFIFQKTNNTIVLTTKIALKKILLSKNDFALWNSSILEIKKAYSKNIIIGPTS